ncbi:MAG: reverse transcriptase family protein, partial [Candidatus Omnitrophica bacterium]|nr:reverse transcriptase family protein [Candidatus Omnitrophota bacterium]
GIKKATGPTIKRSAPLKTKTGEDITDKTKQMERWVEHYTDVYATENIVTDTVLDSMEDLPIMEELDRLPTIDEVQQAIDDLGCGKAPGNDGIPAEVYKCGQAAILPLLHLLLLMCWEQGTVPQDMRDANIITLYKNKGDRSDCNNYRGISLLSIAGKIFARVILKRLQTLAEQVYPEAQCGFRANRSTIDMIFSLRQVQEKCREQQQPLYMAFIDLTKAFDLVSRKGLFQLLKKIGCPPKLHSIVESFHLDIIGAVRFDGSSSEPFDIKWCETRLRLCSYSIWNCLFIIIGFCLQNL